MRRFVLALVCSGVCAGIALAEELPRGAIVEAVKCAADEKQSYALYVPTSYSPERAWNAILLFDAGGRGRRGVERYQAAAEKYGYILAGSNNSRNGPWEVSLDAARAMREDVLRRFNVDPRRVYTAGMSGGARVAMMVALTEGGIAGVMASSAGFPDQPQAKLPFPVFGTAGTEDFNHVELQQLDRLVTSPHRVEVFRGGHAWLPVALATQAVEWMELQATKSGARKRDDALVGQLFASREADAAAAQGEFDTWRALDRMAADFDGLRDVAKIKVRAAGLRKQKSVVDEIARRRAEETKEIATNTEIGREELGLGGDREIREGAMDQLQNRFFTMFKLASAPEDSAERRMARRILAGVIAGARSLGDYEYVQMVDRFRPPAAPE